MPVIHAGYCVIYVRTDVIKKVILCDYYLDAVEEFIVLASEHSSVFKSKPRNKQEKIIIKDGYLRVFNGFISLTPSLRHVDSHD